VNVSPEWRDEIRRRIEAIERGEAQLVPWAEVRARLRSKIDTSENDRDTARSSSKRSSA
jgi:hypothetical protein